jgi:hypothetical protein
MRQIACVDSPVSVARLAVIVALALLSGACGKKGPPLAPLHLIPGPATALEVRRAGSEAHLNFVLPAGNVNGEGPSVLDRVQVYAITLQPGVPAPSNRELLTPRFLIGTMPVKPPPVEGHIPGASHAGKAGAGARCRRRQGGRNSRSTPRSRDRPADTCACDRAGTKRGRAVSERTRGRTGGGPRGVCRVFCGCRVGSRHRRDSEARRADVRRARRDEGRPPPPGVGSRRTATDADPGRAVRRCCDDERARYRDCVGRFGGIGGGDVQCVQSGRNRPAESRSAGGPPVRVARCSVGNGGVLHRACRREDRRGDARE